jgi:hypothetical protein
MQQALFGVDPTAQTAPPQAGANLMGAVEHLTGVVRLNAHDLTIPDKKAYRTTAAAVHVTS